MQSAELLAQHSKYVSRLYRSICPDIYTRVSTMRQNSYRTNNAIEISHYYPKIMINFIGLHQNDDGSYIHVEILRKDVSFSCNMESNTSGPSNVTPCTRKCIFSSITFMPNVDWRIGYALPMMPIVLYLPGHWRRNPIYRPQEIPVLKWVSDRREVNDFSWLLSFCCWISTDWNVAPWLVNLNKYSEYRIWI